MSIDSDICSDTELSKWFDKEVPCECALCKHGNPHSAAWEMRLCCVKRFTADECWNRIKSSGYLEMPGECIHCGTAYVALGDAVRDVRRL